MQTCTFVAPVYAHVKLHESVISLVSCIGGLVGMECHLTRISRVQIPFKAAQLLSLKLHVHYSLVATMVY